MPDFSDEANCRQVIINENYVKDFAPLKSDETGAYERTEVLVNIDLISILGISELHQYVETKFLLSLSWREFRLIYHNLKEYKNMVG